MKSENLNEKRTEDMRELTSEELADVQAGRGAENVSHSELSILKLLDAATPKLHEAS